MAKETVLVPRGLQLDQKGTRRRKTDYARENIISFGIRILPLLPFIRVITGTDFLANTTAQPGIEYQCVEDRGYWIPNTERALLDTLRYSCFLMSYQQSYLYIAHTDFGVVIWKLFYLYLNINKNTMWEIIRQKDRSELRL